MGKRLMQPYDPTRSFCRVGNEIRRTPYNNQGKSRLYRDCDLIVMGGNNMDSATFSVLCNLAARHTGQKVDKRKSALFACRLNNFLRRSGYSDIDELTQSLSIHETSSNLDLQVATAMLDRRSQFVPERGLFADLFDGHIAPVLAANENGHYRIWLAGCGTGQEAYSLLIFLLNRLTPAQIDRIEIIATDVAGDALLKASIGVYSHYDVQMGLSARNLVRYFTRTGEFDWRVSPDLTRKISFRDHNLLVPDNYLGSFDLVVCRNVLSAMTEPHRAAAQRNLEQHTAPDGYLFIEP